MVIKHMMHGPCGIFNRNCPCTKNRASCKNNYPRPFNETTIQGKDSYPLYRRRNVGHTETIRNCKLDNIWVVPYNPYLLRFFNCHINVEGHDRASVSVTGADDEGEIDEIRQYRNARWVTPPEALWRIYGFELSKINPSVMQLKLHLPNTHMVSYHGKEKIENVINRDGTKRAMLTAYFEANRLHEKARGILYRDFLECYTWKKQGKFWQQRKQKATYHVGRIVAAHPNLRTIDGKIVPTFQASAEKRGLIEVDNTIDNCMIEAELFRMPSSLRQLFAIILVFREPNNIRTLWNNHLEAMSEDYSRTYKCKHMIQQMVLKNIRDMLQSMGKNIWSLPLPEIDEQQNTTNDVPREIEESTIEVDPEDASLHTYLNKEQRATYEKILAAVNSDSGGLFFVDGPRGIGKTFLYRALLATIRGQGKIALATATSGVATSIMPGLLQTASLIIWDEKSMTKRQVVEALDKSMRDIMDNPNLPFGGKTVIFGGDFRQVLPVVQKGTRAHILVHNMRAHKDPWFAEYLLRIGNGIEETNKNGEICLPTNICVQHTPDDNGLDTLIENIYQTDNALLKDPKYITSRAILSTRNDCVDSINLKNIECFQGDEIVYHSFDSVEDDPHNYYPPEFLNTLTPNGLPPHMLKLKINCPIILLRNIDPANGLCNGTRLVFSRLESHYAPLTIPLCPSDDEMFPFRLNRKQFPIRLSFAMTINKSQGQTIPTADVYLPELVFSHGKLYVALSRATETKNIKILTGLHDEEKKKKKKKKKKKISTTETYTKNIVYTEVLTK
ncbi:hypothetical protein SEVIR_2G043401v4 [Setaria viridis]